MSGGIPRQWLRCHRDNARSSDFVEWFHKVTLSTLIWWIAVWVWMDCLLGVQGWLVPRKRFCVCNLSHPGSLGREKFQWFACQRSKKATTNGCAFMASPCFGRWDLQASYMIPSNISQNPRTNPSPRQILIAQSGIEPCFSLFLIWIDMAGLTLTQ